PIRDRDRRPFSARILHGCGGYLCTFGANPVVAGYGWTWIWAWDSSFRFFNACPAHGWSLGLGASAGFFVGRWTLQRQWPYPRGLPAPSSGGLTGTWKAVYGSSGGHDKDEIFFTQTGERVEGTYYIQNRITGRIQETVPLEGTFGESDGVFRG